MLPLARSLRWAGPLLLVCCPLAAPLPAQGPPLRFDGLVAGGARASVTEAWTVIDFTLTNLSDQDRQARLLYSYVERPHLHYGRDVLIPARSTLSSWLPGGPAPVERGDSGRSVEVLLFDQSAGAQRLILPPGESRVRTRPILYRKREPFTTVVLDDDPPPEPAPGELPAPPSADEEVVEFVRTLRGAAGLSSFTPVLRAGPLPASPEAFDGVDHLVIASNRLGADAVGLRAVRQWLLGGGTVWVLLDRVHPDTVAPLLGDALDFQVVDRVSLLTFRVHSQRSGETSASDPNLGRPVEFVRVLLPDGGQAPHTLDGWPVWFSRSIGAGKVVFTALGARGWTRPRQAGAPAGDRSRPPARPGDLPSPFVDFPALPVALPHLQSLAGAVVPLREENPLEGAAFGPSLAGDIGYEVIGRGSVALVFGGFLAGVLALALLLRGPRGREALGWAAPGLAVVAAGVLLLMAERSRQAVGPTVAVGQIVQTAPGVEGGSVRGLMAVYRPEGGPAPLGAERGGLFEIDQAGLAGQTRQLVLEDLSAWHWEGLTLPAGVRQAPFRYPLATGGPIHAAASLTETGVEGTFAPGPFQGVSDAVLLTPADRPLAVRLGAGGAFSAAGGDELPPGRFIAGTLLTDRQQRRQELYRQFLAKPPEPLRGRNLLLAWADPVDMHFRLAPGGRTVGDALLIVPLDLRPAPAEARVTIPAALLPCVRIQDGARAPVVRQFARGLEQHLRFQLPAAARPLRVERARLSARLEGASRLVTVSARQGEAFSEVYRGEGPAGAIRVEITQPRLLVPDEEGGLHFRLRVGGPVGGAGAGGGSLNDQWTLRWVELEVAGRTAP